MCLSPHEMNNADLEARIERLKRLVDDPKQPPVVRQIMTGRINGFTKVLKERAEQGVMLSD